MQQRAGRHHKVVTRYVGAAAQRTDRVAANAVPRGHLRDRSRTRNHSASQPGSFERSLVCLGGDFCAVGDELVADSWARLHDRGVGGIAFDLFAQARDPHAQVLQVVQVFRAPNVGQQLGREDDFAGLGGEVFEEQPFRARQRDVFAVAADGAAFEVYFEAVAGDGARGAAELAAQYGADACSEFVGAEGLNDIIVGARFQAPYFVAVAVFGGEEDDGGVPT